MLNTKRILASNRLLRAMTGTTLSQYQSLLPSFARSYEQHTAQAIKQQQRQRAVGGGRKAKLGDTEEKLLFILVYLNRCYAL